MLAAHSQDEVLLKYLRERINLHKKVAKTLGTDKKVAKILNFSIPYGVSPNNLSQLLIDKRVNISKEKTREL
jgi:DNA polymerase I-like protein with 3'-5' exonuclease and polymerase domains